MITEFTFLVWYLGLTVPLYWLIPARLVGMRQGFLGLVSAAVLWMLSPFILIVVCGFALLLAGFALAVKRGVSRAGLKKLSWAVFAPLLLVEIFPTDLLISGMLGPRAVEMAGLRGFAMLGLSYTAIRCFIMCRECLDGKPPSPLLAALTFLFFGSFVAGPITGSGPYRAAAQKLELENLLTGLARIGWGAAVFLVLRRAVIDADLIGWANVLPGGVAATWIETYHAFAVLYLDFAGYTEIAIGAALMFGIRLPDNFRYPFLARSMQEFWQRWHLSLGAFIGTYLFKPLVRNYGKPTLAIFLAFVLVGLWHRFSIPYFIWGIGHGGMLAWEMARRKKLAQSPPSLWRISRVGVAVRGGMGWAFTMTYVAVLSTFATREDFGTALDYLGRLFGL